MKFKGYQFVDSGEVKLKNETYLVLDENNRTMGKCVEPQAPRRNEQETCRMVWGTSIPRQGGCMIF